MKKLLLIGFLFFSLSANSSDDIESFGQVEYMIKNKDNPFVSGFVHGAIHGVITQNQTAVVIDGGKNHFCFESTNFTREELFTIVEAYYVKNRDIVPPTTPYAYVVSLAYAMEFPC